MKVTITNNTDYTQYVDLIGNNKPDDIKIFGPKSRVVVDIPDDTRLLELSRLFKSKLTIRKN